MKVIKYNLCIKVNGGTEEILTPVTMGWNEANEEIAKREAYNGEYTIEDNGVEEVSTPSQFDIIEARLAYVEMMTGLLEV